VDLVTISQIVFAVTAAVAALSLVGAAFDRVGRRVLMTLAIVIGFAAVAAWVAFGFRPETSLAVVAGGITLSRSARS